jgi:hypothetical protein
MKTDADKRDRMRGGVRARGERGLPAYTIELGRQPAQFCQACGHRREWLGRKPHAACPRCGSTQLLDTRERRQETRGGFATKEVAKAAKIKALAALGKGTYVTSPSC